MWTGGEIRCHRAFISCFIHRFYLDDTLTRLILQRVWAFGTDKITVALFDFVIRDSRILINGKEAHEISVIKNMRVPAYDCLNKLGRGFII